MFVNACNTITKAHLIEAIAEANGLTMADHVYFGHLSALRFPLFADATLWFFPFGPDHDFLPGIGYLLVRKEFPHQ